MKRFAVFALAMLVALFPMIANAEDAAELPAEEIWSATVLRAEIGSLLVRIEAVNPEEDETPYPWDEIEVPEPSPTPSPTDVPEAHSVAAEEAQEDDAIGVQPVSYTHLPPDPDTRAGGPERRTPRAPAPVRRRCPPASVRR